MSSRKRRAGAGRAPELARVAREPPPARGRARRARRASARPVRRCTRTTTSTWPPSRQLRSAPRCSCCCTRSSGIRCRALHEALAATRCCTYGWAYGTGGTALQGKDLWLVATTGGPEASYHPQGYNRYFFDAFLPPYEQTAALCGMRFLPPLVLHGARRAERRTRSMRTSTVFRERPARPTRDWPETRQTCPQCPACDVPATDRPRPPRRGAA